MKIIRNYREEEWKAKWVNIDNFQKKCPVNFIETHKQNYNFNPRPAKVTHSQTKKFTTKPISKIQRIPNTEVVVKITSTPTNFDSISRHLDYISRNGKLEVLYTDLEYSLMEIQPTLKGKDTLKTIKSFYKDEEIDFSKRQKKEYRETYNIIFSAKDYMGSESEFFIDPNSVKIATYKTLKTLFPDNHFALVLHTDTNNPHCHICLKVKDKYGRRLDIRKKDIYALRKTFAKELTELGIKSTATYKKDRINSDIKLSNYDYVLPQFENFMMSKNPRLQAQAAKCFEIVDFGEANFDFKEENPNNFFVTYLTKDYKPITIWGEDLKRVILENNLAKGDFARFGKVGFDYKIHTTQLHKNNALFEVEQAIKFSKWDCVVFDKNTRSVNKNELNKFSPPPLPKLTWRFLKKLNTGEYNERPNRIKRNNTKRYTREQWAEYYANKRRMATRSLSEKPALHFPHTSCYSTRMSAASFDNLRTLPQSSLDTFQSKLTPKRERSTAKLLLSNDAHAYISNNKSTSDSQVRRADSSIDRTKRNELNL